jgi:glutathione synthase/RimK-type ligase-like ATP-grasp enzyme
MANICIIGKKGSKARNAISKNTGIKLLGKNSSSVDAIINYGLVGQKLDHFLRKHPKARNIPILNKYVGRPKHLAVHDAEKAGILVPETRLSLPKSARLSDWIEKKVHSSQGKGICKARGRGSLMGKYYQRMINDRRFELRVHAFQWVPTDEWRLNKRFGPADQITWNFHQGGHYVSVRRPNDYKVFKEAKDIALKVLEIRNMAFGAVDLIVDNDMKVYFIEVNSSPGFEELNQKYYFDAFSALKSMTKREVIKFCNK